MRIKEGLNNKLLILTNSCFRQPSAARVVAITHVYLLKTLLTLQNPINAIIPFIP
jgi:hypothetical protein